MLGKNSRYILINQDCHYIRHNQLFPELEYISVIKSFATVVFHTFSTEVYLPDSKIPSLILPI